MDHLAAAQEQIVTEKLKRKLNEVNAAAQSQLSVVQDHVNFNLQQAYFKCAYECFDREKRQDEISQCVEHCGVPIAHAQNIVEAEMAKFQEKMNRSLMVCQDKLESAKLLQENRSDAMSHLESCVEDAIEDNIQTLPHIVARLRASLSIHE